MGRLHLPKGPKPKAKPEQAQPNFTLCGVRSCRLELTQPKLDLQNAQHRSGQPVLDPG